MTRTVCRVRAGFSGAGRFASMATCNRSIAHGGKRYIIRVEQWKVEPTPPPPPPIEIPPPDDWFDPNQDVEELYD